MSRNLKLELPLLQNSMSHNNFKFNYVGEKKEKKRENTQNVHIGITNFNSKLYEKKKIKVSENKIKNLDLLKFGNDKT